MPSAVLTDSGINPPAAGVVVTGPADGSAIIGLSYVIANNKTSIDL